MGPAPSQVAVPPVRVLKCGLLTQFLETFHSWEQQATQVWKRLPGLAGIQEAQVFLTPPVKGVGQPSLPGAFGAGVLSAFLVQMSILAEHRENAALDLQSAFSSLKSPYSILSPPPRGKDQGQSSPWLQREPYTISGVPGKFARFRIPCQDSGTLLYLEARARSPNEASTLYNLDPVLSLMGSHHGLQNRLLPVLHIATHCPMSSDTSCARRSMSDRLQAWAISKEPEAKMPALPRTSD